MVKSLEDTFERMLGKSHDELMEIGNRPRQTQIIKPGKIIGHFTYDFDKETEKFTPTLKYRFIRFFNGIYSKVSNYINSRKD